VIVRSRERGWFFFFSSHLIEEEEYEGFYIAKEGRYEGKLVETDTQGQQVRPFDISITKDVLALFFSCGLLMLLVLSLAKWYKKQEMRGKSDAVPAGVMGVMEWSIMSIHDGMIKKCVGKDYKRYAPYLLTAFFLHIPEQCLGADPAFSRGSQPDRQYYHHIRTGFFYHGSRQSVREQRILERDPVARCTGIYEGSGPHYADY